MNNNNDNNSSNNNKVIIYTITEINENKKKPNKVIITI